jgi:GTPase
MVTVNEIIKKYPDIVFHVHLSKIPKLDSMPQEIESGNTEYKRCLINDSHQKLSKLATQMKWRILEALTHRKKSAIYYIGVEDDGEIVGLTDEQLKNSIKNLTRMAKNIHASIYKIIIIKYVLINDPARNEPSLNKSTTNEIQIVKALIRLNDDQSDVVYFD